MTEMQEIAKPLRGVHIVEFEGHRSDLQRAVAPESVAQHGSKIHRSLPMLLLLPSSLHARASRMEGHYPLFTDKF